MPQCHFESSHQNPNGRLCGDLNPKQFYQLVSHAFTSGVFSTNSFVSSKLLLLSLSHRRLEFSCSLFSQIQNPNLFACNFIFKAFSLSSCPQEALFHYNLVRRRYPHLLPDNYSFPFLFKACGRLNLPHKGQELHAFTVALGLEIDVFVQNGLVSMYSACGLLHSARKVFDFLPVSVRDVVSWNSVVSGYLQSNRNRDALQVFEEMVAFTRPDNVTLVSALTACGKMGCLHLGRQIHGLVFPGGFPLDVFLGSLIDMYVKCGRMDDARRVFDRIEQRNVVCWTSMIAGYAQSRSFKEAIELFREMQLDGVEADAAMVACVISACGHSGALDHGRWVHTYCERSGFYTNISVKNALIDMYSKCGDVIRALEIFHEMSTRDVFTWTAMITVEKGIDVRPNEVTFLGVLSACSHGGFVDKGFHYFRAIAEIYKLNPRIEHYGCMVDLLGRANLLNEAEKFIRDMPIQPDVVIWRSLLFACRTYGDVDSGESVAKRIEELEPRKFASRVLLSNLYASASRWHDVSRMRKGVALQGAQKQPGCSLIEVDASLSGSSSRRRGGCTSVAAWRILCELGIQISHACTLNETVDGRIRTCAGRAHMISSHAR
ncbi:pentatricopeptide repeat-containing protein [Pyrus ussuriensis x Pyrus communis]|uniref:Pentatricopeptide repeat-containing protein n=1 Tax=Pyrus ussuriensis x Pyrus communis TaxID=2448454 RepID=A0A5N5G4Z7_9ROSA|nr:pentatricopeptide repeat-containing protein [Pyrus ussuriensis x Pyrus communis]